ncbi:MAG: ABC transporter related protein [Candidatus Roizmanbacteria bacterium GW2011_GWA2_37_7]|uniref:ABC transporter related protein n=1 Tax=Candidatus Roizmanbacteria bacterium GW2011_GWA2_37_7 TaxID=1618481 RepID=A0A0G0H7P6_9BACT|nr:MAG: ABC transporter related protein [Candidatus Roizmanbacteria bacterium GW2011_GWA2_37_7]
MIQLKHVWKKYQIDDDVVFTALKDISLILEKGGFSALIGPSGSGKSTLMHIIGLLDKATEGEVLVEGKNIAELSDDQLSTLRNEFVGFVFQQFNLINKLTVQENILLPTTYARKKIEYDPVKRSREIMERFGIAEKANSYPNKISGGQQQRVAIARALIMSPSLILADEPTGNLDTKTGNEIMKLLTQLNKEDNITVLIVTHEQDIAAQTKRKIQIIDGGLV